jgi:hypothetical protein
MFISLNLNFDDVVPPGMHAHAVHAVHHGAPSQQVHDFTTVGQGSAMFVVLWI